MARMHLFPMLLSAWSAKVLVNKSKQKTKPKMILRVLDDSVVLRTKRKRIIVIIYLWHNKENIKTIIMSSALLLPSSTLSNTRMCWLKCFQQYYCTTPGGTIHTKGSIMKFSGMCHSETLRKTLWVQQACVGILSPLLTSDMTLGKLFNNHSDPVSFSVKWR